MQVDEVEYTSLDKVSQIETNRYEVNVFAVIMCDAAPPSVTRFGTLSPNCEPKHHRIHLAHCTRPKVP